MRFVFEKKFFKEGVQLVGCDEVGRGALAGPIVAAAVCFAFPGLRVPKELSEVRDSKLLSEAKRETLSFHIKQFARAWSVASLSHEVVDAINIHEANLKVCALAVKRLHNVLTKRGVTATHVYVDGRFTLPAWSGRQSAVVDGDAKVFSIAAASILAKVYRDEVMKKYARTYQPYLFHRNKGYGTKEHRDAILQIGLSPIHRKTFCKTLTPKT